MVPSMLNRGTHVRRLVKISGLVSALELERSLGRLGISKSGIDLIVSLIDSHVHSCLFISTVDSLVLLVKHVLGQQEIIAWHPWPVEVAFGNKLLKVCLLAIDLQRRADRELLRGLNKSEFLLAVDVSAGKPSLLKSLGQLESFLNPLVGQPSL